MLGLVFATSLGWPGVGKAQDGAVQGGPPTGTPVYRLEWVRDPGAEGCISGAALSRLLSDILGAEQNSTLGSPIRLEGRASLATESKGYLVQIRVTDQNGERLGERSLSTTDADCSSLSPAVLLVLVMSLLPEKASSDLSATVLEELGQHQDEPKEVRPTPPAAKSDLLPTQPARTPPPTRCVGFQPTQQQPPRRQAESPRPHGFEAMAATGVTWGLLPAGSLGLGVEVRRALAPSWLLAGSAFYWFPETAEVEGPRAKARGVDFSAAQASFGLCRALITRAGVGAHACAGGMLGWRMVSANALESKRDPSRAFFGPVAGVEASWELGSIGVLRGGPTAQLALPRDRFTYQDHRGQTQHLFKPSLIAVGGFVGYGGRW